MRDFARGPESFLRSNPVGHVTASAIVSDGEGAAVLLVSHARLGGWLQPGGHIEPEDESTFAAALREVREETGLERFATPIGRAILDLDVHEIPVLGEEPAHLHFDVKHLLVSEGGEPPVAAARWYSCDEIPSLDRDGSLTRAVRKARVRLGGALRGLQCSR